MLYRTEQQANIEQAAYSEILCVCELEIYNVLLSMLWGEHWQTPL